MIPNIENSKICWVDRIKKVLLVWWGGTEIKIFKIKKSEVIGTYTIEKPYRPGFPSFTQVKNCMREIINKVNKI